MAESGRDESQQPTVVDRRLEYECPWFEVVVKDVRYPGETRTRPFYSVELNDWATVLAVDADGRIPLVRQYRPVIERVQLELPAGAVRDAPPEETARRELLEETGYQADELVQLGSIFTEAGRLTSRAWVYFAANARRVAEPVTMSEEPLEVVLVTQAELCASIGSDAFASSGHVAAVGLALIRGLLSLPRAS
ncbi:MAG: NUDIX hydrolase [Actinomycetota bacterium]